MGVDLGIRNSDVGLQVGFRDVSDVGCRALS